MRKLRKCSSVIFFFSLCLSFTACAPSEQPFVPLSDDAKLDNNIFYTADMTMLPYRAWLPRGKPRAVIVALHGFNDYSNAFSDVGTYFAERRIAVYAYDQRGFGAAPQAGVWGNRHNLVSDLGQFARVVAARHPRVPLYILGESMGGAVAVSALVQENLLPPQGERNIKGLILVAPALWGGETMPLLYRGTLWASAHLVPYWHMTGSDLKILASDNLDMLRRMYADPLVIKSTRVDAIYGLVQLMDVAYGHIPGVNLPTLVLYGGNDQVITREPMEVALARFTRPVQFVFYPDGYHMLLRDLDGERAMDDIVSWIRQPARPLPSGFGVTLPYPAH